MKREYAVPSDRVEWEYFEPASTETTIGTSRKVLLPYKVGEPEVFIARRPPMSRVSPHYHPASQFVVVVDGNGFMGRESLKPGIVEYTDKNTAYGPLDAGSEGLTFFNCRQLSNNETFVMPESRSIIPRPQGRQKFADPDDVPYQVKKLPGSGESVEYKLLIGSEEEGPWAEIFKVGPGQTLQISARTEELGQYHLVLEGELIVHGEILGPWSVRYIQGIPESGAVEVGSSGATVAVLSFDVDG